MKLILGSPEGKQTEWSLLWGHHAQNTVTVRKNGTPITANELMEHVRTRSAVLDWLDLVAQTHNVIFEFYRVLETSFAHIPYRNASGTHPNGAKKAT